MKIKQAKVQKTAKIKAKNIIKVSEHIKTNYIFKHASLLALVIIVLISNYLTTKTSQALEEEYYAEQTLIDSAAVSEEDLVVLVSKINKYTPMPTKKLKAQKIVSRLYPENQIVMADEQYIAKPSVLITYADKVDNTSKVKTASGEKKISYYYVRSGDTISGIASRYGISANTIKGANGLSSDIIKAGQRLMILPADGVVHTVQKGETLSGIVAHYSGNLQRTISGNNLSASATIFAGQKIVIVGGRIPASTPSRSRVASAYSSGGYGGGISVNRGRGPNHFPFGWCTWYVASRRYVPWRGNAGSWAYQASRYGYSVGRTPAAGAIIVTRESWWGHVGYVESVNGSSVTISEMNFTSWGRVNYRTLPASYGVYIY